MTDSVHVISGDDPRLVGNVYSSGHEPPPPEDDLGAADGPICPVIVLGHVQGVYYLLSPSGELRSAAGHRLDRRGIKSLFDGENAWLVDRFPVFSRGNQTGDWDADKAAEWLIRSAVSSGFFDAAKQVRGGGAWAQSGNAPLYHAGGRIWTEGRGWQPAGQQIGKHVYTAGPGRCEPLTDAVGALQPAGADVGKDLIDLLESWSWRPWAVGEASFMASPAPTLLAGWIAIAPFCGALSWRPHVWLTGDQGTGKSSLLKLVRGLTDPVRVSAPTEASVRQMLRGGCWPVNIDECEGGAEDYRARDMVKLARIGSDDDQAPISRGTAEGVAIQFPIRSAFLFASILVPAMAPQDRSRITRLDMDPLTRDPEAAIAAEAGIDAMEQQGGAIRARMLSRWGQFRRNLLVCRSVLMQIGNEARFADQTAPLLAAADVLISDKPTELQEAMDRWGVYFSRSEADLALDPERAHWRCWHHLLTASIDLPGEHGGRYRKSVGEMLSDNIHGILRKPQLQEMRRRGVSLRDWSGPPPIPPPEFCQGRADRILVNPQAVIIANNHQSLEEIFRGTDWQGGLWSQLLARLPGAAPTRGTVAFGGARQRGVQIPAWLVEPPEDGSDGRSL